MLSHYLLLFLLSTYLLCICICILEKEYTQYTLIIYSFAKKILIFICFMLWLQRNSSYSFETPGTVSKRLQKLTTFSNTTLNNKNIQKALASWIFKILSPFEYQKIDCSIAPKILTQCIYGCIRYCWIWLNTAECYCLNNKFSINNIANYRKFKRLFTSGMFREYFLFVGACIIDCSDIIWNNNLRQAGTYSHLSKQCMFVSLKLAQEVII